MSRATDPTSLAVVEFVTDDESGESIRRYRSIRQLTSDEAAAYFRSIEEMTRVLREGFAFAAVSSNYVEVHAVLAEWCRSTQATFGSSAVDNEHALAELERRLFNLLAIGQSFIQHVITRVKLRFGRTSREVDVVVATVDDLQDRHPGLAIMRGVRNLFIHRGPPRMAIRAFPVEDGSTTARAFLFKDDLLRSDRRWHHSAKAGLERYDNEIPLIPLMEDYMSALGALHRKVTELGSVELDFEAVERLAREAGHPTSVVILMRVEAAGDNVRLQSRPLGMELVERVRLLMSLGDAPPRPTLP